jgi:hypothetical protein
MRPLWHLDGLKVPEHDHLLAFLCLQRAAHDLLSKAQRSVTPFYA